MADSFKYLNKMQLLRFFHVNKASMSCMENPHTFLNQLRDHDLITEDRYQLVRRMENKEEIKKALYDFLDWFEKAQSHRILDFWKCVFNKIIMGQYPVLQDLHKSLIKAPVQQKGAEQQSELRSTAPKFHKMVKKEKTDQESKEWSQTLRCDEEKHGPSSHLTPDQKVSKEMLIFSPLKKGDMSGGQTSNSIEYPVTCGDKTGMLNIEKLGKGERCILVRKRWFLPPEFEKFARMKSKNWKSSIRYNGTPLGTWMQKWNVKAVSYRRGYKRAKKSQKKNAKKTHKTVVTITQHVC